MLRPLSDLLKAMHVRLIETVRSSSKISVTKIGKTAVYVDSHLNAPFMYQKKVLALFSPSESIHD